MTHPTPAVRERALSLRPEELPAYLYDVMALRAHMAEVRAALPERVELYYAAKANPEPELLAALRPYVDGYEVSSGGELAHVGKAVPGAPLAFGGPGKTPAEITQALDLGVERFHVESVYELHMLASLAADRAAERRFDWAAYGAGLARLAAAHPGLTLRIEPGRALTAYCGWYATEVLDVKQSHGEEFAVVRGGTHHLRTPATKEHDQPCTVLAAPEPWPHPWPRSAARGDRVTVTGQLCTPKDVLSRAVPAPGLRAGRPGGVRGGRGVCLEHLAP